MAGAGTAQQADEAVALSMYSVVVTSGAGEVWFELLLLKGEPRSPQQILEDLRRATAWLEEKERYRISEI